MRYKFKKGNYSKICQVYKIILNTRKSCTSNFLLPIYNI